MAVYPRVCGGTDVAEGEGKKEGGLSPRVRGNRSRERVRDRGERSIPACAGEPGGTAPRCTGWTVYPRVCGGTFPYVHVASRAQGLSPRRGNRNLAGQPVYPRVCGGTELGRIPSVPIPACAGEPPASADR